MGSRNQGLIVETAMVSWLLTSDGLFILMLSAQDPKFWETICNCLSLSLIPPPRLSPGRKKVKVIPHLLAVWEHHMKWPFHQEYVQEGRGHFTSPTQWRYNQKLEWT